MKLSSICAYQTNIHTKLIKGEGKRKNYFLLKKEIKGDKHFSFLRAGKPGETA